MKITSPLFEIRPSTILENEVGLFAVRALRALSVVVPAEAFKETWTRWDQMTYAEGEEGGRQLVAKWCYFNDEGAWLPESFDVLPNYAFLNHSCDPNIGHDGEDWIALRDIAEDEELFMDFRLTGLASWFSFDCRCGSQNCSGTVRGDEWMDPGFAREHLHRFPPFFVQQVAGFHGLDDSENLPYLGQS